MTAAEAETPQGDPTPLNFSRTPEAIEAIEHRDRVPFTLDDDDTIFWATKPKTAVLLNLGVAAANTVLTDDDESKLRLYDLWIDSVLDDESGRYLRRRFFDRDDTWDVDMLDPVMEALGQRWYARPTGGQSGSAGLPRTTGRRSTGRSRSKAKTP